MNTQQTENDNAPLTHSNFKQFCAVLCEGLNPHKTGDVVQPHEVMSLHSDVVAEDGRRIKLFDLYSGRTSCQADDGAITVCD